MQRLGHADRAGVRAWGEPPLALPAVGAGIQVDDVILDQHAQDFFQVEGQPGRTLDDLRPQRLGQVLDRQQGLQQLRGLVGGQRLQADKQVALRQPLAGSLVDGLHRAAFKRPRNGIHQQRSRAGAVEQEADQVERSVIGPVQVFQDQQQRPLPRFRQQQIAHCQEDLLAQLPGVQVAQALARGQVRWLKRKHVLQVGQFLRAGVRAECGAGRFD